MFANLATSVCLLCNMSTKSSLCLCAYCLDDLPVTKHSCLQCGNTLPIEANNICGKCQTDPPPIDRTFSLYEYKTPVDHLIKQLKFKHSIITADLLGKLMAQAIIQQNIPLPEAIIPIPLHNKRLRMRGYNQAIEIAKPLAKQLKLPLLTDAVIRHKHTPAQTKSKAKERRINLRNSFNCKTTLPYTSIALVDDVITTGATINEVAKVLKKNGVQQVYAWSCAHSKLT